MVTVPGDITWDIALVDCSPAICCRCASPASCDSAVGRPAGLGPALSTAEAVTTGRLTGAPPAETLDSALSRAQSACAYSPECDASGIRGQPLPDCGPDQPLRRDIRRASRRLQVTTQSNHP